jgi:hypothetical protein
VRRGFVLFIVATFVSMALVAYSQRPIIPLIEGLELAAAQQEFGDDFKLVGSEKKSCQPKGTILSQSPKPDAETQWVEKISVVVSAGRPKSAQLPDVVDKPRDEAERILTDKGFKVEVKTKESSQKDVGKVLEQSPPACGMKKDSKVAITIGKYSPPSAEVNSRGPQEVPLSGEGTRAANPKEQMAPTIAITSPADDAVYSLNQPVKADYSCVATEGSELASCTGMNGTVAVSNGDPIDTSTAGSNSFTVTATDNAGNTNSLTHNYKVGPARPAEDPGTTDNADNANSLTHNNRAGPARPAEDPDRSAPGHSQYANN